MPLTDAKIRSEGYAPLTHARLSYLLTDIPTKVRYAVIISKCDDAERGGLPWGAIFWKEIRSSNQ